MQYGPTVDIETYRFDSILGATVSIKPFWMRFFPSAGYERGCDNFKDPEIMEKRIPQFLHMGQWKKNFKRPTRRKEQ